MRFWDASAVMPLALEEARSAAARILVLDDPEIVAWWGTPVECASAATRLRRERRLDSAGESTVLELLDRLRVSWLEVAPSEQVRSRAVRLLRVHPLRAGDAFQLAAALAWATSEPGRGFVTLDNRLADAARTEGFDVLMPSA